jgi:ADP-ribose pyrophosphatase YjhB (NUDIX family)
MAMNFCSNCGAKLTYRIPDGDDLPRYICDTCHIVHYLNPKMVVGCIPEWKDRLLLCRRAIEPRKGKWTLPAGYLENNETLAEGAKRETLEEARADVEILAPYAIFNLTFINQIYLMFRGNLIDNTYGPGLESTDVALFLEKDIPWNDLAFNVIRETLVRYFEDRSKGSFPFHMGDIAAHRYR